MACFNLAVIKIIQVGKSRDFVEQEQRYLKMLGQFAKVEVVTVGEQKASKTIEEEGKLILRAVGSAALVIALDEKGKEMDSLQFGRFLGENPKVTFVIGGAFGLSDGVRARADAVFSLSLMTFTHQMVRLFLLEQIYRGFCIIKGKEYHH